MTFYTTVTSHRRKVSPKILVPSPGESKDDTPLLTPALVPPAKPPAFEKGVRKPKVLRGPLSQGFHERHSLDLLQFSSLFFRGFGHDIWKKVNQKGGFGTLNGVSYDNFPRSPRFYLLVFNSLFFMRQIFFVPCYKVTKLQDAQLQKCNFYMTSYQLRLWMFQCFGHGTPSRLPRSNCEIPVNESSFHEDVSFFSWARWRFVKWSPKLKMVRRQGTGPMDGGFEAFLWRWINSYFYMLVILQS